MTLIPQLRKALAFDEQDFKNIPINGNARTSVANIANQRLAPIYEKLMKCIEAILKHDANCGDGELCMKCGDKDWMGGPCSVADKPKETPREPIQKIAEELSLRIAGQVDAHLFESIVSLFNQGVLAHYVRSPRMNVDSNNFNMTVEAASGVKFEGREKIIALEKERDRYREALEWYAKIEDNDKELIEPSESDQYEWNSLGTKARKALKGETK